jgi:DNA ligase-associated metallophosphoesterase
MNGLTDEAQGDWPLALGGAELRLCAQRAVYWPAREALLIADPHFGKAACFRQAGMPVPSGTTATDLDRLTQLIDRTGARVLYILGDFYHAARGRAAHVENALIAWRERHAELQIVLIPGNHDAHAGAPPAALALQQQTGPMTVGPLVLAHEPTVDARGPVVAGHVHPAVRLNDAGISFRLPCFQVTEGGLVLPAFGSFTGMHTVEKAPGQRLLPIADGQVLGPPSEQRSPAR